MPLDITCKEYKGKRLYVEPIYGWGWWEYDEDGYVPYTQEQMVFPTPLHIRVNNFYDYNGSLQGAVGKIEEESHFYHGFYIVFYIHHEQPANFTDRIADYNVQIGPDIPELGQHPTDDPGWPLWIFSGRPYVGGYAYIGESKQVISSSLRQRGLQA